MNNKSPRLSKRIAVLFFLAAVLLAANWLPVSKAAFTQESSKHWAYVKPVRPALPAVKTKAWVRNAIDAFILARLEKEGLAPAPEADKTTLLRRVYLDLTGLPPTPQEAEQFLADQAADAYEKVVDRLLSSPHYGERWARPWLDLARYADSHGYEKDRPRVMWKYRDWVINALNADMPFDQFTLEQLAGDLLEKPGYEQLIATGFHRNTMLNQEGGVDDEEARWETIIDRVNTTATVWLGSTIGCAQCHNHKYDPFTQKEFYKLFAFFDTHEYYILTMPGSEGWVIEPELELPTPAQAAERSRLQAESKTLEDKLKTQTPELSAALTQWESELRAEPQRWAVLEAIEFKTTGKTKLEKLSDKSLLATGAATADETYVITAQLPATTGLTALRLEALADARLPHGGPGRDPYGNFVLSGVEAAVAPANNPAQQQRLEFTQAFADDAVGAPNAQQLFRAAEQTANGWAIDATRDEKRSDRQAVFTLAKPFPSTVPFIITIKLKQFGKVLNQGLGRVRLSVTEGDEPQHIVALPLRFKTIFELPAAQRTEQQQAMLAEQFRQLTPLLKTERAGLRQLRAALDNLGIVKAPIIREKPSFARPSAWFHIRGNYLTRGEKVYAAPPAALHVWPEDAPYNRLGLARWLISRENPLTARVTVNRFWEQIFGRGLVETSEDFGLQSAPPSHPELLDWLAVEFMEGGNPLATARGTDAAGWSMKKLHRLLVTSATYRQSSAHNPQSAIRNPQLDDPYNRLLARGPRFRLEAETIRDTALAASGLLSRKIGGPSVYPVQPEGIWANPYDGNSVKWTTSTGADRYRRSLYTFLRRTAPYPLLTTFDATSREFCTVRRVRTNTPLQALSLLNDEALFELARALARRMLTEVQGDVRARLSYGFRLCVVRAPSEVEVQRLETLFKQQLEIYRQDKAGAARIAQGVLAEDKAGEAAEVAAWTMTANVLLNLDELLTKE